MKLELPSVIYKDQYFQALVEGKDEDGDTFLDIPRNDQSFEDFVQMYHDHREGLNLPEGWVPSTMFWLIHNDEFIGRVSIRHSLNDYLYKYGGNIGYYIRASKRKMGYGKKALELALKEAKKLGLSNVLITVDDNNLGSQKIILANGGVFENAVDDEEPNKPKTLRYWISF